MEHTRRTRRITTIALLGLTLTGGAIGGVVGSAATARWLTPAAQTTLVTTQPILQATTTNVASSVLQSAGSSVVEIITSTQLGFRQATATGTGSGFVIDSSGLIVTNLHVVSNAGSITVAFSGGETRAATVAGTDSANDLALLRVDALPDGVSSVTLGDSDQVVVGETAVAIGSPFGLEQTVTQGIINAVDRDWSASGETLSDLIQTDTPINPGNSGGPLLNADGAVIGINTLIESLVEGNVGVGFAIPVNTLRQQFAQLETGANLEQGYLGVSVSESPATGESGVTVEAVAPGSGAAQARRL